MEYWSIGVLLFSITPSLHHAIRPIVYSLLQALPTINNASARAFHPQAVNDQVCLAGRFRKLVSSAAMKNQTD
jgi:hypothetical protein